LGCPDIFLAVGAAASAIDPGHSLRSLDSATGGAPIAPQRVCQFHHARIYLVILSFVLLGCPDIFLAVGAAASAIDPGHSLSSLTLPPAAVASLPTSVLWLF